MMSMSADSAELECRVCRSGVEDGRPLYHPCFCTGSIGLVHQDCLEAWLEHSKKDTCELCSAKYQFVPQYAENTPTVIPPLVFLKSLCSSFLWKLLPFAARVVCATIIWLLVVPVATTCIFCACIGRRNALLSDFSVLTIFNGAAQGIVLDAVIALSLLVLMSFTDFLRFHWVHGEHALEEEEQLRAEMELREHFQNDFLPADFDQMVNDNEEEEEEEEEEDDSDGGEVGEEDLADEQEEGKLGEQEMAGDRDVAREEDNAEGLRGKMWVTELVKQELRELRESSAHGPIDSGSRARTGWGQQASSGDESDADSDGEHSLKEKESMNDRNFYISPARAAAYADLEPQSHNKEGIARKRGGQVETTVDDDAIANKAAANPNYSTELETGKEGQPNAGVEEFESDRSPSKLLPSKLFLHNESIDLHGSEYGTTQSALEIEVLTGPAAADTYGSQSVVLPSTDNSPVKSGCTDVEMVDKISDPEPLIDGGKGFGYTPPPTPTSAALAATQPHSRARQTTGRSTGIGRVANNEAELEIGAKAETSSADVQQGRNSVPCEGSSGERSDRSFRGAPKARIGVAGYLAECENEKEEGEEAEERGEGVKGGSGERDLTLFEDHSVSMNCFGLKDEDAAERSDQDRSKDKAWRAMRSKRGQAQKPSLHLDLYNDQLQNNNNSAALCVGSEDIGGNESSGSIFTQRTAEDAAVALDVSAVQSPSDYSPDATMVGAGGHDAGEGAPAQMLDEHTAVRADVHDYAQEDERVEREARANDEGGGEEGVQGAPRAEAEDPLADWDVPDIPEMPAQLQMLEDELAAAGGGIAGDFLAEDDLDFDAEGPEVGMEIRIALFELLGLEGPLYIMFRNALWLVGLSSLYLTAFVSFPYLLGKMIVLLCTNIVLVFSMAEDKSKLYLPAPISQAFGVVLRAVEAREQMLLASIPPWIKEAVELIVAKSEKAEAPLQVLDGLYLSLGFGFVFFSVFVVYRATERLREAVPMRVAVAAQARTQPEGAAPMPWGVARQEPIPGAHAGAAAVGAAAGGAAGGGVGAGGGVIGAAGDTGRPPPPPIDVYLTLYDTAAAVIASMLTILAPVAVIAKVGVLLVLRIFALPLFLGTCILALSSHTVFLFSMEGWAEFLAENMVGAYALAWVTGITFMLSMTISVLQLREVLHPDILAKLIRPQEAHMDLINSLVNEDGMLHVKRLLISCIVYLLLMALLVWVPLELTRAVLSSPLCTEEGWAWAPLWLRRTMRHLSSDASDYSPEQSVDTIWEWASMQLRGNTQQPEFGKAGMYPLKLRLWYVVPEIQIPLELLIAHISFLSLIDRYKDYVGRLQHLWMVAVADKFGLTRFLLPLPRLVPIYVLAPVRPRNHRRNQGQQQRNDDRDIGQDLGRERGQGADAAGLRRRGRRRNDEPGPAPQRLRAAGAGAGARVGAEGRAVRGNQRAELEEDFENEENERKEEEEEEEEVRRFWAGKEVPAGPPLVRPPPGWDVRSPNSSTRWAWGKEQKSGVERNLAPRVTPSNWFLRTAALVVLSLLLLHVFTILLVVIPVSMGRFLFTLFEVPPSVHHDPIFFAIGCLICAHLSALVRFLAKLLRRVRLSLRSTLAALLEPMTQRIVFKAVRLLLMWLVTELSIGVFLQLLVRSPAYSFYSDASLFAIADSARAVDATLNASAAGPLDFRGCCAYLAALLLGIGQREGGPSPLAEAIFHTGADILDDGKSSSLGEVVGIYSESVQREVSMQAAILSVCTVPGLLRLLLQGVIAHEGALLFLAAEYITNFLVQARLMSEENQRWLGAVRRCRRVVRNALRTDFWTSNRILRLLEEYESAVVLPAFLFFACYNNFALLALGHLKILGAITAVRWRLPELMTAAAATGTAEIVGRGALVSDPAVIAAARQLRRLLGWFDIWLPSCVLCLLVALRGLAYCIGRWIAVLYDKVRDDNYLIGRRLQNTDSYAHAAAAAAVAGQNGSAAAAQAPTAAADARG